MKIYAITDTHLGHDKLWRDWQTRHEGFDQEILDNLAKQNGDILLHLGDVCIGKDSELVPPFIEAAKNFKHLVLVKGNHDNKSDSWYYGQGFDFVCDEFTTRYFGKTINFTHAPICSRNAKRGIDYNIHGHLHGTAEDSHRQVYGVYDERFNIDLAPEIRGYKAISLEGLLKQYE